MILLVSSIASASHLALGKWRGIELVCLHRDVLLLLRSLVGGIKFLQGLGGFSVDSLETGAGVCFGPLKLWNTVTNILAATT